MTTAVLERPCEHCGNPFTPRRSTARFCRDACRTAHGRSQRPSEPNANGSLGRLAAVTAIRSDEPLTWEPTSEPRHPNRTAEPCRDCGDLLLAGRRGTWRVCGSCRCVVVPAAVSAPYARGGDTVRRHVVSQRERDLEAIALARRKGVMLAQLAQLGADDQLHPESVPVVEWLTSEVRGAATDTRLDELAALAADPAAAIRRRHWWQSQPAAIAADYDDEDQADEPVEPAAPAPRLAIVGRPVAPAPGQQRMTWSDALARLGWRLAPVTSGCQVRTPDVACGAAASRYITGGSVCGLHHWQLAAVIAGRSA